MKPQAEVLKELDEEFAVEMKRFNLTALEMSKGIWWAIKYEASKSVAPRMVILAKFGKFYLPIWRWVFKYLMTEDKVTEDILRKRLLRYRIPKFTEDLITEEIFNTHYSNFNNVFNKSKQ